MARRKEAYFQTERDHILKSDDLLRVFSECNEKEQGVIDSLKEAVSEDAYRIYGKRTRGLGPQSFLELMHKLALAQEMYDKTGSVDCADQGNLRDTLSQL